MKLNKEEIRQIALDRFHDKHHDSIYDCWTDALEVWLSLNNLEIVKKSPEAEGEAIDDPEGQD